jgi:hypothetical protein
MIFASPAFTRAEVARRMEDEERQLQGIGANQLFGQRTQRVGVKLRVGPPRG